MPPAYEQKFTTAAHVQGIVVKDSGSVTFSHPSCYRISLSVSKNETSTCGDTTWIRSADGSVTVTANKNIMDKIENQGIAGWRGSFSPVNLMKRSECSIKSEGKDITVALTVSENKTKTETKLLLNGQTGFSGNILFTLSGRVLYSQGSKIRVTLPGGV
ncbi:MAG: hypothetical protein GX556_16745, partial [Fibrobacter sp.]|nr:hypothetical protein [Fibrobacter sp.]